jgi:lysophospholipase L1-like esterase
MFDLVKRLGTAAAVFVVCLIGAELFVRSCVSVRNVGPSFTTHDSRYGKVLKPGISVTRYTPEFKMTFTTNSHGFRGPELSSLEAGSILFVGDSFTMGYGVTDGKEYPALVREASGSEPSFDRVQVINAAMGDNGNGRALIFLESDAVRLNPRIVVLQIHGNDFLDNVAERFFELGEDGELKRLPVPASGSASHLQRMIEWIPGLAYSHLVGLTRQLRLRGSTGQAEEGSTSAADAQITAENELMLELLDTIVGVVEQRRWALLVVLADIQDTARLTMLEDFFDSHGVGWVVVPAKPERPDLYYLVDGHWNETGQAHAADVVLGALRDLAP